MLKITNLSVSFSKKNILKNINLNVKKGEIVGLIGNNGTGKTTLMKAILGLIKYNGEIEFQGSTNFQKNSFEMQRIGMLLQEDTYLNLNALQTLTMIEILNNMSFKENYVNILDGYSLPYKRKVKEFSFGMKQRLRLAIVLNYPYDLLILDEPYVGLDPLGVLKLQEKLLDLKNNGVSVIISSHQLSEIDGMCDRFVYLSDGKLTETEKLISKKIILNFDSFDNLERIKNVTGVNINNKELILNNNTELLYDVLSMFKKEEMKKIELKINQYIE
ncbi:TPA: ATP-binding cassette domain-containing protein [Staphylococcus delphini]|nr:ATP-binding cassette domain-containing protein [Staphylococcus delphini]HEC2188875.1 ATP-binding cassette domain-containing protein [Staphylococcus delphini]HEC2194901.1 ATP-binding cassette domain-containing protein [Staphylococcus delphini]HEC2203536.1 ATP-binding cassette domain-containing protein [Staphylococcus delphini]HEC2215686.1 ATP-binding cassette domain-containing protein [Staphylococcus delphini]